MIGHSTGKFAVWTLLVIALSWATPIFGNEADSGDKYAKLKEARRLTKAAVKSLKAGQYDSALIFVDLVLLADSASADAWYYRALAKAKAGDTATAVETLVQGAARAPLSTRIKLLLARLNLIAGDSDGAEAMLDQILAIKPKEGEAHYLKALAQLGRADTTAALESFGHALKAVYPSEGKE